MLLPFLNSFIVDYYKRKSKEPEPELEEELFHAEGSQSQSFFRQEGARAEPQFFYVKEGAKPLFSMSKREPRTEPLKKLPGSSSLI